MTLLLVTGCYRSGTTLLDKLLHAHPQMCVASQPIPPLYSHVKAAFDRSIGIARTYPLYHLFGEDAYAPPDLHAFLDSHGLSRADLDEMFDQLERRGDPDWTPQVARFRDRVEPGAFLDVFRQIHALVATLFSAEDLRVVGSKEIVVEELAPYLVDRGVRVAIIVRDPRDVIASANFSERASKMGEPRPVLYNVRAWRKSVAFATALADHANLRWLRYEDLVARPAEVLAGVADWLGIEPFEPNPGELRDQHGRPWRGNSSFADRAGVSTSSVGAHADRLPRQVTAYIETACLPEMRLMGYRPSVVQDFDERALRDYRVPFATVHPAFDRDYSVDPARLDREVQRFRMLAGDREPDAAELTRWFVDPRAFARLRAALR